MKYGQFCPIAKASEVLGERWMLPLLRELMAGSTRFRDLKRGLGRISPSLLSSRLKMLIDYGVVEKTAADGGAGWEYRLTPAGSELAPIIESIGVWGQRWVRSRLGKDELDVELLMLGLQRSFDVGAFPKRHGVLGFVFSDLRGLCQRWWLLIDDGHTELCTEHPGRTEDVTLTCELRTLTEAFVGDLTLEDAVDARRLRIKGPPKLVRSAHRWLRASPQVSVPRPR